MGFRFVFLLTSLAYGGGALEDLGVYNRDSRITLLSGIGMTSYEKFKEHGIETMSDLKKNPNWFNLKSKNDKGHFEFILDADDRAKAKKQAEKYFDEK